MYVYELIWIYYLSITLIARCSATSLYTSIHPSHSDRSFMETYAAETVLQPSFSSVKSPDITFISTPRDAGIPSISPTSARDLTLNSQFTDTPVDLIKSNFVFTKIESENEQGKSSGNNNLSISTDIVFQTSYDTHIHTSMSTTVFLLTNMADVRMSENSIENQELFSEMSVNIEDSLSKYMKLDGEAWNSHLKTSRISSAIVFSPSYPYDLSQDEVLVDLSRNKASVENSGALSLSSESSVSHADPQLKDSNGLAEITSDTVPILNGSHGVTIDTVQNVYSLTSIISELQGFGSTESETSSVKEISSLTHPKTLKSYDSLASLMSSVTLNQQSDDIKVTQVTNTLMHVTNGITSLFNKHKIGGLNSVTSFIYTDQETNHQSLMFSTQEEISDSLSHSTSADGHSESILQYAKEIDFLSTFIDNSELISPTGQAISSFSVSEKSVTFDSSSLSHMVTKKDSLAAPPSESELSPSSSPNTGMETPPLSMGEFFSRTVIDSGIDTLMTVITTNELFQLSILKSEIDTSVISDSLKRSPESSASESLTFVSTASDSLTLLSWEISLSESVRVNQTDTPGLSIDQSLETGFSNAESFFTSIFSSGGILLSTEQTIYMEKTISSSKLFSLFPSNREATESMVLAMSPSSLVIKQTEIYNTIISGFHTFSSKSFPVSPHVSLNLSLEMSAFDLSTDHRVLSSDRQTTSFIPSFTLIGSTAMLHAVSSILKNNTSYSTTATYSVAATPIYGHTITASTAAPFSTYAQDILSESFYYTGALLSLTQTAASMSLTENLSPSLIFESSLFNSFNLSYENHTLSEPYHTSLILSSSTSITEEMSSFHITDDFLSASISAFAMYLSTESSLISVLKTISSEYKTVDNVDFTASSINGLSSKLQDVEIDTTGSEFLTTSFSVSRVIEYQPNRSTNMISSDYQSDKLSISTNNTLAYDSFYNVETSIDIFTTFSLIRKSEFSFTSSASTNYSMNSIAISAPTESLKSTEIDSSLQTHMISQFFGTSVSQTMIFTSFLSDVISTLSSAELFSEVSLKDFTSDVPLSDFYLSNSTFPFSTNLSGSYELAKSTLFSGLSFDTKTGSLTESSVSNSVHEGERNISQNLSNLFTSFIASYATNLTSPISSFDLKSSVSYSTIFSYGTDKLSPSFAPFSSYIISSSLSPENIVSKHSTEKLSQKVIISLSSKSMLSATHPLNSSLELPSISELDSKTPILSSELPYLVTTDTYLSSVTENSPSQLHSSAMHFTSALQISGSRMSRTSHFTAVSSSAFRDQNSNLLSTSAPSYSMPTTKTLKESTSFQVDSNVISFMLSSQQITPSTTTSGIPNPTVEPTSPTVNITDSRENFWVKTVLMARKSTNISGTTFRADIETRMAEAYNEAFKRERLIEQGLFESLRRKRYSSVGEASVHIHDITRVGDTTSVNIVYAVEKTGIILTAAEAATTLNVLDAQELAIILRQVVQTVAEPYQSSSKPSDSENGGIPLWLIATIAGSVAGLIILTWVSVCIYVKCFRERKEMEKQSEPTLTAIQQNDDMKDTSGRNTEHSRASTSVKYDMSRKTSKTSFKQFSTYQVQQADEEALIENASGNKIGNATYENMRASPHSFTENQDTVNFKSPKRQGEFGSNASLSNNQMLEPIAASSKPSKPKSVERGLSEGSHSNTVYTENFEMKPKSHPHKYKVLQSSFSDQDNEELKERSRRERQANKERMKLKKRKNRPSVIDSSSDIPYSSIDMPSTRLPKVKVESGSPVKDVLDNTFGSTDRRPSAGDLSGDESLEEARSRMHKLLDDAFSLISPRASFAENTSKSYGHPFAVQSESAKMLGNKTFGMPETDLGSDIREESMYVNPAYDSQSSFPLETWSPYRASDLVAMISMPSKQEHTRLGQKPKPSTRSLSSVSNRRPAANFDFSESKSASALKDEKYTTRPAKPIVIRSKDLVEEFPQHGNRDLSSRTNSGRAGSDRTNSGHTNIGRSNNSRTNSGRSLHGRTTVMVNPLPKENQSEQYDMTFLKNKRNSLKRKPKVTEMDRIDSYQGNMEKTSTSDVNPNSDKFIQSLRDELSELKDMYVCKPNEHRNNKKHASSIRTDV